MNKFITVIILLLACTNTYSANLQNNCGYKAPHNIEKYVSKYHNRNGAISAAHLVVKKVVKRGSTRKNTDRWLKSYNIPNIVCISGDGVTTAKIYIRVTGVLTIPAQNSKSGMIEDIVFRSSIVIDDINEEVKFNGLNNMDYIVYKKY